MTQNTNNKYFAFISYSSHDQAWGKRLQRKLEHYRMPSTLCSERGWKRKPMDPVFFAPTDIQPGGLTEELQERLRASQHLIVICSPHSARSEWVGKEIEYFHSLGRTNHIHLFIIDGKPNSGDPETECFNPVLQRLGLPEILGANIHEPIFRSARLNRERAYVQLISKLLDVEFDSIWQRHRRLMRRKTAAWIAGTAAILVALGLVWRCSQPVDVKIAVVEASEHNDNLPSLRDVVVTLYLPNETKTDTLHCLDNQIIFANIPHRGMNKPVRLTVSCRDCITTDTTISLSRNMTIGLRRDPSVYGDISYLLWNPDKENTYPGTELFIEGQPITADSNGYIKASIPLSKQRRTYTIKSVQLNLVDTVLIMPCGPDAVVQVI